jgi:Dolichyl-phosphate-mannose-protein mannosyltransferase
MAGSAGTLPIKQSVWRNDVSVLLYIATATVVAHVLAGGRYGFHRDELATLDDARHLAWGYVAYPPVTPFFGRLSLLLFGTSLAGFRFFAALADAVALVFAALIARDIGGGRSAQLLAALAATPFCLGAGTLMQYVSFDYLFWVLTAYFLARVLSSDNPRWWIGVGISIGLGMLTKYSMLICVVGVVLGVLLTHLRIHLKSKWLWIGAACSLLIFLPNFIWQLRHDFVSVDFLRHIHERDIRIGRTRNFLPDQLELTLFALPLAIAGLYFYFFARSGRPFQALGWMYVVAFAMFLLLKGRGYYLEPAYPVLFAGGSVWMERALSQLRPTYADPIWGGAWMAMAANVLLTASVMLPLAPVNSPWWQKAVKINGDFAEEIGWPELVETVARIRDSLPEHERTRTGILAGNYGEAGAINLYGPRFGLPKAISGINSFWARGYGDPPPETLIVVGFSRDFVEHFFESFELVAHTWNRYGVANEETTRHPDIFVCRRLRPSWPEFWKDFQRFG